MKVSRENNILIVSRYLEQKGYQTLITRDLEDTIDIIAMKKENNIGCPGSSFTYARTVPLLIRVRSDVPKEDTNLIMQNDSLNWSIRQFSNKCGYCIPMIACVNNENNVEMYHLIQPCHICKAKHV